MSSCKYCGRLDENNPSDYYHYHDCWARDVSKRLEEASDRNAPHAEILELEHELERARYVGD